MISRLSRQSTPVKAVIIIGMLVITAIAWWLISPLFLPGRLSDEEIDLDDPNLTVIGSGELVQFDNSHWGEGTIRLVEDSSGNLIVQFIDVEIANGPSLVVYLTDKASYSGISDSPGNYVDLGDLPANSGSFTIKVTTAPQFDIASVMIWCDPFDVVFTYAMLS